MSAATVLQIAEVWLWIGAAVALVFLTVGLGRIDEDARGAYVFRPLLVPGVLLLWPLVLWRWGVLEAGRDAWALRHLPERQVHRWIWGVLAILVPLVAIVGLVIDQEPPDDVAPVRLEAPA